MTYILFVIYLFACCLLIYNFPFFRINTLSRKWLILIFFVKLSAGISLGLIYRYYYPDPDKYADTYKYFNDSKVLYELAFTDIKTFSQLMTYIDFSDKPHLTKHTHWMDYWSFESQIIIRVNALMRFLSGSNYYVHVLFFSFLSFLGSVCLYKFLCYHFPIQKFGFLISVFFIPSVIFWGSGAIKEAITIFSTGVLLFCLNNLIKGKKSVTNYIGVLFSFYLLSYNQYYLMILMFPCVFAYWLCSKNPKFKPTVVYFFSFFIYWIIIINGYHFGRPWDFLFTLYAKQQHFIGYAIAVNAGSLINYNTLEPNFFSMIECMPRALYNVLFFPNFFSGKLNSMNVIASTENILIILLFIFTILGATKKSFKSAVQSSLFQFSLYYSISLFLLIGLTIPVAGAIVRYKVPVLIFMVSLFVMIIDEKWFVKKKIF